VLRRGRQGRSRDAIRWLRMRLYEACVSPGMQTNPSTCRVLIQFARTVVLGGSVPLVGPQEERAHSKQRGVSHGAAARHSQYARLYMEFLQQHTFFFIFPSSAYTEVKNASSAGWIQNGKKKPESDFGAKRGAGKDLSSAGWTQLLKKKLEFSLLNSNFDKN